MLIGMFVLEDILQHFEVWNGDQRTGNCVMKIRDKNMIYHKNLKLGTASKMVEKDILHSTSNKELTD